MALQQSHLSVLLVEDNPGDARLVEHHLNSAVTDQFVDEVSLTHVESLDAGLDALDTDQFDVLLLDLGLPKSTGLETIDRAMAADVTVPIIVLTGLTDREASIEAITRGAQDYLPKDDLDSDRLIRAVRYAIERHQQERMLQRQTEQMSFFNQILRHDMLNGMNVIRARGELLAADLEGEQAESAETIVEWSDDIIDLTEKVRTVLGTLTDDDGRELRPIDLETVAGTAAERAESLGGTVSVDVPEDVRVRADDLLEDVLSNLTMNAVAHGGEDIHVTIDADVAGTRVTLRVADDGTGIDPAEADRLFERGETGGSSSGSGFGLYFVDSMVDAYGGTVDVAESEAGGAVFTLELPAARQYDNW